MNNFLIYGATGYTGKIMAKMAVKQGLKPILSGRNEDKLKEIADPLDLEYVAVDLQNTDKLNSLISKVDVVIHCAGPFSATSEPMINACMNTGTHYLDITGEIEVFESLNKSSDEAAKAGIMVMPGVGFDVVPTDCLAAHIKNRMPGATHLSLSIGGMKGISPGTAKTAVESIGKKTLVRRNGIIVPSDKPLFGTNDFGNGESRTIAASWGDVSTAYYTTGIPNVTVYFQSNKQMEKMVSLNAFSRWLLSTSFMQKRIKSRIEKKVKGPTDEQRERSRGTIIGEARNEKGEKIMSKLIVPEGYTLTCLTGLEIVRQVLAGKIKLGFWTPASLFGADFILQFEGVERNDIF
jgi:short subunit dehydrogenase-like uncharacterized protein